MIIYGKNPVMEILSEPRSEVEEVWVAGQGKGHKSSGIIELAMERGVKISYRSRGELSKLANTSSHQGFAARVADFNYTDITLMLSEAKKVGRNALILFLDHIEDPQNLGAIIRTANVLGADGVVIPKDRAAPVTPAVVKASSGATNFVPIAQVVNLRRTIKEFKEKGYWVVGADQSAGKLVFEESFSGLDIIVVIGNEGKGISVIVKEECDFLVSIPQTGEVSSLNASVAAGILLYEIGRQRKV